jgi:hypothetical protein
MAISNQLVQLNASTKTLVSIPRANQAPYETKVSLSIQNLDRSIAVYLGTDGVNSENFGFKLLAGQTFTVDLLPGDNLYAIADSLNPLVAVFAAEA